MDEFKSFDANIVFGADRFCSVDESMAVRADSTSNCDQILIEF